MTIRKPNIDPSDHSLIEFLTHRPRRLRRLPGLRRLVRETVLTPADFIYPLFVVHGTGIERAIEAMPGQAHRSIDRLPAAIDAVVAAGVPGVILFGLPANRRAARRGRGCPARPDRRAATTPGRGRWPSRRRRRRRRKWRCPIGCRP